ncbi:hypothetical protein H312_02925 [Anncaliia algerae PRA339]|uniref:Uncharacterized protein n=1 Tax=Anncaliia algerae PRA339 TaxID=1288291 RepID=A0A059EY69_9MICR|nr:hypothetical protein H312_02925 [Anncaliia algerae PRA339]
MEVSKENKTAEFNLNENSPIKEPIKQVMEYIAKVLRNSPKKKERKCRLCDREYVLNNLIDLFACYGACIFCASNHTDSVEIDLFKVFYLETYLLSLVDIEEVYSVEKSLQHKKEIPSEEKLFAKKLSEVYLLSSKEPKVKFFLRQEIDSLTYILYDTSNKVDMAMLLYLLFLRNETKRYFEVLKEIDIKTIDAYKLGILLKLEEENCKEVEELIEKVRSEFDDLNFRVRKYKSAINLDPFNFFKEDENNEDIQRYIKIKKFYDKTEDLIDKDLNLEKLSLNSNSFVQISERNDLEEAKKEIYGPKFYKKYKYTAIDEKLREEKDFNDWVDREVTRLNWRDCISMWSSNRNFDSKLVDTAMIDVCSVNKRFKEGWDIFNDEFTAKISCLQCTANLCLCAVQNTGNELWIERLSYIMKTVNSFNLKNECCEIASNSVPILCSISEEKRTCVLKTIIDNMSSMAESDKVIFFVLETLLRITTRCKSADTCQLCIDYASKFYDVWKTHKKGFFFTKKGQFDEDILCCMLGICTETTNCDKFSQVIRDVKKYDPEIDYDTKIRLQKFHDKYHTDCKISTSLLRNPKELINHYIKYKK